MTGATFITTRGRDVNIFKVRHDGMDLVDLVLPHLGDLVELTPREVGCRLWELWEPKYRSELKTIPGRTPPAWLVKKFPKMRASADRDAIDCPEQKTGLNVTQSLPAAGRTPLEVYRSTQELIPSSHPLFCSYEDCIHVFDLDARRLVTADNEEVWRGAAPVTAPPVRVDF